MLRFIGRRIVFIILIYVLIVFFACLGMRMIRNSEISRPDYDILQHGKIAWQDTHKYLSGVLRGHWGTVRAERGPVAVEGLVWKAYVNSMGLLLAALVSAAIVGLLVGSVAALIQRRGLVLDCSCRWRNCAISPPLAVGW
jgi:ABC-type dipeptide/oligopeptide/nickel transport system permease component